MTNTPVQVQANLNIYPNRHFKPKHSDKIPTITPMKTLYLAATATLFLIPQKQAKAAPTQKVKIYLVALGDAGKLGPKFGCDDSLVAVSRSIAPTTAPLTAAINQLLATPRTYAPDKRLSNNWFGPGLKLKSASVQNGLATLRFDGHVAIAGVCDTPRIEKQIEATALQFKNVKKVRVFVGNETLSESIS
jgi:spore germination protein GerM